MNTQLSRLLQLYVLQIYMGWAWLFMIADPNNEKITSSCFNQTLKQMSMDCVPGSMVHLTHLYYGYNPSDSCTYTPGDCILDVPKLEMFLPCIGRQSCEVNLPTGSVGNFMPKCGQYSTYMQAHYHCVPETEVLDICEHSELTGPQKGYLATPHFPNNYPDSMDCQFVLSAPYVGQKLELYIIDLNLESNNTDCADWLQLHDGFRSSTFCSLRTQQHVWTTVARSLQIHFHSNNKGRRKGFWLYFEAVPYISSAENPTAATNNASYHQNISDTHPTDNTTGVITGVKIDDASTDSTSEQDRESNHNYIFYNMSNSFPVGIIVGIVLGAVLCITVITLIVIVVKRRDPSKLPLSISCTSTTAFLNAKPSYPKNNQTVQCINNDLSIGSVESETKPGPYIDVNKATGEEQLYC